MEIKEGNAHRLQIKGVSPSAALVIRALATAARLLTIFL